MRVVCTGGYGAPRHAERLIRYAHGTGTSHGLCVECTKLANAALDARAPWPLWAQVATMLASGAVAGFSIGYLAARVWLW